MLTSQEPFSKRALGLCSLGNRSGKPQGFVRNAVFNGNLQPSSPSVTVVVLNFNGHKILGKILEDCLQSVLATDYPDFEVVFVDNASTDDSIEYVRKKYSGNKNLRIIQNEENLGFTGGNNEGIRCSKGNYLVLLNTDTRVDPNWLTELVKAAQPADVGAAQSKLLKMDSPGLLDCAGGLLDHYGYPFERGQGEKSQTYNEPAEVFYSKGASVLLKREVLEKTGLFDEDVFLYFDEVDLCWRIWLSGYRVVYAPKSVVWHASGSTTSALLHPKKLYFYTRNHMLVLLKNYNLKNAALSVKVSIRFEARNAAAFLAKRKPRVALSIVNALIWNVVYFEQTWKKRQIVQHSIRKVPDKKITQQMLKPVPPFPFYLIISRSKYFLNRKSKR